jgi:hypothetical protein
MAIVLFECLFFPLKCPDGSTVDIAVDHIFFLALISLLIIGLFSYSFFNLIIRRPVNHWNLSCHSHDRFRLVRQSVMAGSAIEPNATKIECSQRKRN